MDSEPTEETPAEIQESLMGALLRSRGVPGGLQGVQADASVTPEVENDVEPSSDEPAASSVLGISPETMAAVGAASGDSLAESAEPAAAEAIDPPEAAEAPEAVEPPEAVDPPEVTEPPEVALPPVPTAVVEPIAAKDEAKAGPAALDVPGEEPDNIDDPDPDGVGRIVLEWVLVLVGAVVMALVLRQFLFQAFWIPSESMETTLEIRDRVLVNRLSYQWGDVGRGDIVVFARKPEETGEIRDLIKRVIGLPGETVEGRDNAIYIDGARLDEPYVAAENASFGDFGPIVVPADELFVMGDNRDQSFDSRLFGTVHEDRVAGRAFVLFWPLDRIGPL